MYVITEYFTFINNKMQRCIISLAEEVRMNWIKVDPRIFTIIYKRRTTYLNVTKQPESSARVVYQKPIISKYLIQEEIIVNKDSIQCYLK